jgi:hypothetical protein
LEVGRAGGIAERGLARSVHAQRARAAGNADPHRAARAVARRRERECHLWRRRGRLSVDGGAARGLGSDGECAGVVGFGQKVGLHPTGRWRRQGRDARRLRRILHWMQGESRAQARARGS